MKYIKNYKFWIIFIAVFYTSAGFFLIPYLITSKLPDILRQKAGIDLSIKEAKFNPFSFELNLNDIVLNDQNSKPALNIKKIYLNYDLIALLDKTALIKKIDILSPVLYVNIDKNGNLNLTNIVKTDNSAKNSKPNDSSENPKINILLALLNIKNAEIDFKDLSSKEPFDFKIKNLNYKIVDLSTKKGAISANKIEAVTDNGSTLSIEAGLGVDPLKIYGEIDVKGFQIPKIIKYKLSDINAKIEKGYIDLKLPFNLNFNNGTDFSINKAKFSLYDLKITQKNQKIISLKNLSINDIDFFYPKMSLEIEEIDLDSPYINAVMYKNGKLNLQNILPQKNSNTETKTKEPSKKINFTYLVKRVNLNGGKIDFFDKNVQNGAKLSNLTVNLKNISSDKKTPIIYDTSAKINKTATLALNGKFNEHQKKISADLNLKKLNIADFKAYIKPYVNLELIQAFLSIDAKSKIILKKDPAITLQSSIKLENLEIKKSRKKLVAFKELKIDDVEFSTVKNALSVKSITLDEPFVSMQIDKNGTTNFSGITKTSKTDKKEPAKEKTAKTPSIFIGDIKLSNANINFEDKTLPIPFKTDMKKLNGEMTSLDFQSSKPSKLSLKGVVGEYGYANVSGELLPLKIKDSANLKIQLKNIDLPTLTPYSGKFIGYAIKEGKLSLDLSYKIRDSKMIGDNKINLDTLTLGEKIKSKDAVNLPLGLAIAILKDSNGQIDIDLPVKGDLNDPKFDYSKVIWRAIGNLIVGIVTSPFKFLGSMLGIETEKLKSIDFELGNYTFVSSEMEKVEAFKKILSKRPGIKLIVDSAYDKELDLKAMQLQKLEEEISKKEKKLKKSAKKGEDTYAKALKELYTEKFSASKYDEIKKKFTKKTKDKKEPTVNIIALNDELKSQLSSSIKITDKELENLASKRLDTIINTLSEKGGIKKERLKRGKIKQKEAKRGKWVECSISIGT